MKEPVNPKIGSKYRVVTAERPCKVGDIITLVEDDGTEQPYFAVPRSITASVYPASHMPMFWANLEPAIGPTVKPALRVGARIKFGGVIKDKTVTLHIGNRSGTATYNPDDAATGLPFRPELGVLLAYCRAAGIPENVVDEVLAAEKTAAVQTQPLKAGDVVSTPRGAGVIVFVHDRQPAPGSSYLVCHKYDFPRGHSGYNGSPYTGPSLGNKGWWYSAEQIRRAPGYTAAKITYLSDGPVLELIAHA